MLPHYRSLPDIGIAAEDVGAKGWHVTDLLLPALTLRRSSLLHNVELFARWCTELGVSHAPHAKTHLSPELVRLQLDSGAWGMAAASVSQARLLATMGVRRILLAHQVADRAGLGWLARTRRTEPTLEIAPLVDSVELVARMEAVLVPLGVRDLPVLMEIGREGGRTGARDVDLALAVGDAVNASVSLRLVGVESFEGVVPPARDVETLAAVDGMLTALAEAATRLSARGAFTDTDEILFTAGGSTFPDRVAAAGRQLTGLARPVRTVVRSGAYITHEHGPAAVHSPLSPESDHSLGALRPSLELWATVVSTPEPGLAIVAFGKRDAPYDVALPTVLGYRREGRAERSGIGITVVRLNDQHAYLSHLDVLHVGDIVRCGVAHPCTAFDRWPLVAVLDDDDRVIDAVTTMF